MMSANSLDHLPTCYLNACALYSSIGLHAEALRHALLALQILQQRIQSLGAQVLIVSGFFLVYQYLVSIIF